MKNKNWFVIAIVLVTMAMFTVGCASPVTPTPVSEPPISIQDTPVSEPEVQQPTPTESQPTESEATPDTPSTDVSIRFLAYPWFALSEDALQDFTNQTGIQVTLEVLGYEELNTKVAISSAARVAPADVFSTYVVPLSGHVSAGFVTQLDGYLSDQLREDLLGLDVFRFNDKQMGIPTYYDVVGLVINMDILAQAGINRPPETIEELHQFSLQIKEAGIVEYPLVIPLAAQSGTASRWELLSLAMSGEPLFDIDYNPLFLSEDSGGYKALKYMIDSVGVTIDPALVELIDLNVHDIFLAGDGAFIFSSASQVVSAKDPGISSITDSNVIVTLVPGSEKVRSAALNFYLDGFAISEYSQNKEEAWKFIEWWLSDKTAEVVWQELEIPPMTKHLLEKYVDEGLVPGGDFVFEQSEYGLSIFAGGIPPWFEEFEIEAASQINQAARGTISFEAALQNIADLAIQLKE
jgi:multiple sugar transport system substrate-binding protein